VVCEILYIEKFRGFPKLADYVLWFPEPMQIAHKVISGQVRDRIFSFFQVLISR